jgi:uncharacterized membrane protein HdeD (DUF308 family)
MSENMLAQSWVKDAKRSSGWLIGLGAFGVIVGIMALGSPLYAGKAVSLMVGTLLVFTGITSMFAAFKAGTFGAGLFGFLGSLLTLVAGMIMWTRPLTGLAFMTTRPLTGLAFMTLVLAFYFLFRGISGIMVGLRMRPVQGWGWTAFSGAVDMLLGILIWRQWPLSGTWAIGILVGIHILFQGWALISVGLAARVGVQGVEEAVE